MTIHITLAGVWAVGKYVLIFGAGLAVGLWLAARALADGWRAF